MSDLLDKHSEDYDPERFLEIADNQRKADKENGLDRILPAPPPLSNFVTGEVIDRDDAEAVTAALALVEDYIDVEVYRKHRWLFRNRDDLRARQGELKPIDLPRRRDQSKQQELQARCPRCRTRIPHTVIEEAE